MKPVLNNPVQQESNQKKGSHDIKLCLDAQDIAVSESRGQPNCLHHPVAGKGRFLFFSEENPEQSCKRRTRNHQQLSYGAQHWPSAGNSERQKQVLTLIQLTVGLGLPNCVAETKTARDDVEHGHIVVSGSPTHQRDEQTHLEQRAWNKTTSWLHSSESVNGAHAYIINLIFQRKHLVLYDGEGK